MIKTGKERRKIRNRIKISGTSSRPRITVHKSNKFVFVQAVDDSVSKTIASIHEKSLGKLGKLGKTKAGASIEIGKKLAEKLINLKIKEAVFNKGGYKYHGKVKNVAEGLREAGIKI